MSNLIFRSIERSDIPDVQSLFHLVFNRDLSAEYYLWQFFESPFGGGYSKGAWVDDTLVAHVGYTPREFIVNGRPGKVLSNHTMMSHPDHRGKGYYSKLIKWAVSNFAEQGWDMVISHPNRASHPVQMMHDRYVDITILPALTWRSEKERHSPVEIQLEERFKPCRNFGDEYRTLCEITSGRVLYTLKRSPDYLSWRYGRRPNTAYFLHEYRSAGRLLSAVIFKLYPREQPTRINICEWLCPDDDRVSAERPLMDLLDLAEKFGLEVQLWHSVYDKPRRCWLERLGFYLDVPVFYFGVYALKSGEYLGPYTDFRYWYHTMGDHDVF